MIELIPRFQQKKIKIKKKNEKEKPKLKNSDIKRP